MNDRRRTDNSHDEPPKREWVVQKLPIKGGNVLRSAMHIDLFYQKLPWVEIEGTVIT